jgi:hypothetical protein
LSLRKLEATRLTQATSVSRKNVKAFLGNLNELISKRKFSANKIYNLDETCNSTVHVSPKIICAKGMMQVGRLTSGERGINVTVTYYSLCSAASQCVVLLTLTILFH